MDVRSWVIVAAALLVFLSVARELVTGVANLRGVGRYTRAEHPRQYWQSVLLKLFIFSAMILVFISTR